MITHNDKEMLENGLEHSCVMSFDAESDMFTIDFTAGVEDLWDAYTRLPLFKRFVQDELRLRYKYVYDYPERDTYTEYEITGFLYALNRKDNIVEMSYSELMEKLHT